MKSIKDPIYGYIEIEDDYFKLIDSAPFQRLRNIRQTGYQALYPSAEHTRFVHSLGVFHLGKKAISCLKKNLDELDEDLLSEIKDWALISNTFLLACLLHDVGHSPFSHTGEDFYVAGINFIEALNEILGENYDVNKTPKDSFKANLGSKNPGKPHESMSALIGLDLCQQFGVTLDRELFVRSIIGLPYTNTAIEFQCRNAVISMLNGDLIDVDKLDYVIRDAFLTGFSSMAIDIDRLLKGFTICKDKQGKLCAAYQRKSLSVIENVIYANDLERRWVQNHPVILYDCKLVECAITNFDESLTAPYNERIKKAKKEVEEAEKEGKDPSPGASLWATRKELHTVFSKQALSPEGLDNVGINLRLLCDDDVTSYLKNRDQSMIKEQFFSRAERCKPMWKTEAEFEALTRASFGADILERFLDELKSTLDILQKLTYFFINQKSEKDLQDMLFEAKKRKSPATVMNSYERAYHICALFKGFQEECKLPDFKFAAILSGKFSSAYKKLELDRIKIELAPQQVERLDSVISVEAKRTKDRNTPQNLFYIYTTKKNLENLPKAGPQFFDYIRRKYEPDL